MRCEHREAYPRIWQGWWTESAVPIPRDEIPDVADAMICAKCGAWLSLGPSNDEPEAVRIEMRAAEMLACHEQDDPCRCFYPSRRLDPLGLERQARDLVSDAMWTALVSARHEGGVSRERVR